MLQGKIQYLNHLYHTEGYSFPGSCSLLINSTNQDDLDFLDVDGRTQFFRREGRSFVIKPTNVAVESELDEANKPLPVNVEFPAMLGAYFNAVLSLPESSKLKLDKEVTDKETVYHLNPCYVYHPQFEKFLLVEASWGIKRYSFKNDLNFMKLKVENLLDIELNTLEKVKEVTYPWVKSTYTVRFNIDKIVNHIEHGIAKETIDRATAEQKEKLFKATIEKIKQDVKDEKKEKIELPGFNKSEKGTFLRTLEEVIRRHPNRNFEWLKEQDYHMVTDETVEEVVKKLLKYPYLAVDIETTGLKLTFKSMTGVQGPYADQVVGYIFCGKPGESYFFPLRMNTVPNLCNGDHFKAFDRYIRPLLQKKSIYHNAQFDAKGAFIYQQPTNLLLDTMVAFMDTWGYERKAEVGLKSLTTSILGLDTIEISDLTRTGRYDDANFADVPEELVIYYACPDADMTLRLYQYIVETKLLERYKAEKVVDIDSQFSLALAYQEFWGMHIDVERLPELKQTLSDETTKHFNIMKEIINDVNDKRVTEGLPEVPEAKNFNPNSVPQILKVAYVYLNIPMKMKRDKKKGIDKPTLDKKARKKLLEELPKDSPGYRFIKALKDYNDSYTMVKTFTKNLNEIMTEDGFTFSSVRQFLETGRLSTSQPAYQNYSVPVKEFITGRPGFNMSDNDFSSIEYKVIAGLSGDERLIEAFQDPSTDYHKLQAANMYNVKYELVTDEMRSSAKSFNFGIPFGMGPAALGELLMGVRSPESEEYARKMTVKYFKGQEKVEFFFENTRKNAIKNGYSSTYFGRRRYYDKRKQSIGSIRRAAGNQPIQGTAADSFKIAATEVYRTIIKNGWFGKVIMCGFIHDEMLFEVHESIHPLAWMKVIKENVELRIKGFPPFYLGWGYGYNWKQAKKIEVITELQDILVKVNPWEEYPDWDGDGNKFNEWLVKRIKEFEIKKVWDYLIAEETEGTIIDNVMLGYITGYITKEEQKLPLTEKIQVFCQHLDLDGTLVKNIKEPEKEDAPKITEEFSEELIEDYESIKEEDKELQKQYYIKKKQKNFLLDRLNLFGNIIDLDNNSIIYNTRETTQESMLLEKLLGVYAYDLRKREDILKLNELIKENKNKEQFEIADIDGDNFWFVDCYKPGEYPENKHFVKYVFDENDVIIGTVYRYPYILSENRRKAIEITWRKAFPDKLQESLTIQM